MNVILIALALLRTPGDINSVLSIVFVGPGRFDPKKLGTFFKVRKKKIWRFLLYLTSVNKYYKKFPLIPSVLNLYPEDDTLPGLEERVVYDSHSNPHEVFEQETAGFAPHPASSENESENCHNSSLAMVESMGISDPESTRISGRAMTASAIRNLIPKKSSMPDIAISHGDIVKEYDNPALFPGMFPSLFPLGTGGFEDCDRKNPVGFRQQAEYFLDLADRSFRHHRSFMFVALNIYQRRTAHLHTALTVRKQNFSEIANHIVKLTAKELEDVAHHFEKRAFKVCLNP